MRYLLLIFIWCTTQLLAEYSIVFVHIGGEVPTYTDVAISQARLFNPNARIILVSNTQALKRLQDLANQENIELYSYEELPKSINHQIYDTRCISSAFWRYTSERFLYLSDLMETHALENVFHLENDNMLYCNLETYLADFQTYYPGIAATFDNEERCIPGFVWISGCKAMQSLAAYFAQKAETDLTDMYVMGKYRLEQTSSFIDRLPIIMPDYATVYPLESLHHHKTNNSEAYFNQYEIFRAIFDAAAIGQFLGGIDPIHENNSPGFINESCLFNPSFLEYQWIPDERGRLVPYAIFQNRFYRIINLHVHSKRLADFRS